MLAAPGVLSWPFVDPTTAFLFPSIHDAERVGEHYLNPNSAYSNASVAGTILPVLLQKAAHWS